MSASKSAVNRAGDELREWRRASPQSPPPKDALGIVWDFRASFIEPMLSTTSNIRRILSETLSQQILVSNRLKRWPQIVRKLVRMPETRLARMEDIGGCRAIILGEPAEMSRALELLVSSAEIVRVRDYIASPKSTGYRGIHVVVNSLDRRVEVQLRTPGQQQWASAVERAAGRLGANLKDGEGPPALLDYLTVSAAAIAALEQGGSLPETMRDELERARAAAAPFMADLSETP